MGSKVDLHLKMAESFLQEAMRARNDGHMDRSLARNMYYAAYHAASALLSKLGYNYRRHRETQTGFRQHVVKFGILARKRGVVFAQAQTLRDELDYDLESVPDPKKIRELHDRVIWFVQDVRQALLTTQAQPPVPEQGKLPEG